MGRGIATISLWIVFLRRQQKFPIRNRPWARPGGLADFPFTAAALSARIGLRSNGWLKETGLLCPNSSSLLALLVDWGALCWKGSLRADIPLRAAGAIAKRWANSRRYFKSRIDSM